jgi:hypothetical protein
VERKMEIINAHKKTKNEIIIRPRKFRENSIVLTTGDSDCRQFVPIHLSNNFNFMNQKVQRKK